MKKAFELFLATLVLSILVGGCTDAPGSAELNTAVYYDISWSAPTTRADGNTPLLQTDIAGYVVEIYHGNTLVDTIEVDASTLTTSYLVPANYIDKALRAEVLAIDGEDLSDASTPYIAFSDIIAGPNSGLGDGKGQGAIVTIWGNRFGEDLGSVQLIDQNGMAHQAAHIYYWQPANGTAPGGPSNLWDSHQLYEIAFSVPSSLAEGVSNIVVTTAKGRSSENEAPFEVRPGNIYHVKETGDNDAAGSYDEPWRIMSGQIYGRRAAGNRLMQPGDIVYSHGVPEIQEEHPLTGNSALGAGLWLVGLEGEKADKITIASYPGKTVYVSGTSRGVKPHLSTGLVISKMLIDAGNVAKTEFGTGILQVSNAQDSISQMGTTQWGRAVGNAITDREGMCATGYSGGIVGGGHGISGFVAYGNHIYNTGCKNSSHFQHTIYWTIRGHALDDEGIRDPGIEGFEFSYNRLTNNMLRNGIHIYDQTYSKECLGFLPNQKISVTHNYVSGQRGAGINIHTNGREVTHSDGTKSKPPCWAVDVEVNNNILVDTGLGPMAEERNGTNPRGIRIGGWISGKFDVTHNTLLGVSDESSRNTFRYGKATYAEPDGIAFQYTGQPVELLISNNAMIVDHPMPYIEANPDIAKIDIQNNFGVNSTATTWTDSDKQRFELWNGINWRTGNAAITNTLPLKIGAESDQLGLAANNDPSKRDFYNNMPEQDWTGAVGTSDLLPGKVQNLVVRRVER